MTLLQGGREIKSQASVLCKVESSSSITCYQIGSELPLYRNRAQRDNE